MNEHSPYTIISKIGKGGMAEVFKAIKTGPDGFEKTVALKKIIPFYTDHPQFIKMLSTEAKIHSQLDHPNIVQLYDFFSFNQQYMIAMEYVDGRNAKELITACKQKGLELPWQACVFIIIEVLKALHYAHNKKDKSGPLNIVHRDISPHNILISFDGRIKLSDFGIANAKIKEDKTKSGVLKGKYRYLAPEQVTAEEITAQTDIFSSGVTLYELLCFLHPFSHDQEFELLKSIVQGTFTPIGDIKDQLPVELQDALMMAMQPEPEDRFANAKAFLDELVSLQDTGWLSFGTEELAKIMTAVFPSDERVEIPVESTKVLEESSIPVSIETDQSLIQDLTDQSLKLRQKKPISLVKIFSVLFVLFGIGYFLFAPKGFDPSVLPKKTHEKNNSVKTPSTKQEKPEQKIKNEPVQEKKTTTQKPKPEAQELKKYFKKPESKSEETGSQNPVSSLGILTFSGPVGSEVFINGKKIGILPMKQYFLSPGSYLVLIINGDRRTMKNIKIKAGQSRHVEMR